MTPHDLDETLQAPYRLRTMALLNSASSIEFSAIREMLDVSDSVLSKHLKVLADATYIRLDKPQGRGRVRTWVTLTDTGRDAYVAHVSALRAIIAEPSGADGDPAARG